MIQLGKFQDLYIVKKKDFGVYVNDRKDSAEGSILLPAKQVPEEPASVIPSLALSIKIRKTGRLQRCIFPKSR